MADLVWQAELSQGEVYRVYRGLCFAVMCCDRVSDIESKSGLRTFRTLISKRPRFGCQGPER